MASTQRGCTITIIAMAVVADVSDVRTEMRANRRGGL
jgi:hypothetical protein